MPRYTYQPSMSDIRQAKQSSQLAGTVDDISHLGSKSQENKPLDDMVHQTILRRELRYQESRHSSQENVCQEIKPSVAQPVLNPKYSSVQPTFDFDLPSDQFFKRRDASAKLSSVKPINPKRIQENGPQETRSNQETAHQPVELQKVEPQKVERRKAEKVDRQEIRSNQDTSHQAEKVQLQKVERHKVERHKVKKVNPQEIRSNQDTAHQPVELQKIELQKVERHKVDPQEGRHNLTHLHNLDLGSSTKANPFLAQLTAKPQEIKSDRYTRDQGEYTAQLVHNNIPGQHPTTNLSAKTKQRECPPVEIKSEKKKTESQEVKPQAALPIKFSLGQRALDSELSLSQASFKNNGKLPGKPKKSIGGPFAFFRGVLPKQVKTEDLSQDDVVIAVMGPTGSGKSTFIQLATGFDTGVGHSLESCTSEIHIVKLSVPELADGDVVFVDTPGFDHTHESDTDMLKMVADWLKTTSEKKILLGGLLYFHRITDNRMACTLKNLHMFEELCGTNGFHNVILTTTMWDEVDDETGNLREQELKTKHWKSMLERKSTTSRFLQTRESALRLIEPLIDAANAKSSQLLQREMEDMRAKLPATSACVRLFSQMEVLVKRRQEVLEQIRNAMKHANEDKTSLRALQEEYQRLKIQLDTTIKEMQKLLPFGVRLSKMTRKLFSFKFSS